MASANEQASKSPLTEGQVLDGYRIARRLGEGGMGVVYEGVHEQRNERVAIKILHAEIAKHREVTLRFINEARAVEIINHPGLVRTIAMGQLGAAPYIIMEYLDGSSLSGYLREHGGRMPLADALDVARQVADALAASHDKGIVHRDLKPDNVMLLQGKSDASRFIAKVFDFGIAKLPPELMSTELTVLRTQSGQLLGTPNYMAPEQCMSGKPITDKVDVYALGTMLFRCLAGRTPFVTSARGDAGLMHLCAQQIAEPPPPIRQIAPEVPESVETLLARMLAKEAPERPSMKEMSRELAALLGSREVKEAARVSGDEMPTVSAPIGGSSPSLRSMPSTPPVTWGSTARVTPAPNSSRRRILYVAASLFGLAWFVLWVLWALGKL